MDEGYSADDLDRLHSEPSPSTEDKRGPFEQDRSRIIHSAAFRRLQGKTQVYGLGASDYYRTRLTHSLEVAQIGKAIAMNLGADPSLVEAICLAHDIGHPPFGHAGEYALHNEMLDVDGFNGNAQNIRILTDTERKSESYRGLNLTKATLDGLIKYPWSINHSLGRAKGYYKSDEALVKSFKPLDRRTFECQVMNWADDVAYSSHDLEDALVIGTVRQEDLRSDAKRQQIYAIATSGYSKDYIDFARARELREQDVVEALSGIEGNCMQSSGDRIAKIKTFIGKHIADCVTSLTKSLVEGPSHRYQRELKLDGAMVRRVEIYKAITFSCVILTNPVLTLQQAGRSVVVYLYKKFTDHENAQLRYWYPIDWNDRVDAALVAVKTDHDPLAIKRLARDYIATMTDRFAEEQWRRLNLPGEGALFVPRA